MPTIEGISQEAAAEALEGFASKAREVLTLVEKLEATANPRGHGLESDRRPASGSAAAGGDGGSAPEEPDAPLTADEWNEFISETLERIGARGLDDPKAHLEFVRRQLRAAVA